jgi:hypothetical protein
MHDLQQYHAKALHSGEKPRWTGDELRTQASGGSNKFLKRDQQSEDSTRQKKQPWHEILQDQN